MNVTTDCTLDLQNNASSLGQTLRDFSLFLKYNPWLPFFRLSKFFSTIQLGVDDGAGAQIRVNGQELETVKSFKWLWWCGFFLACEDLGRMFVQSFSA